MAAFAISYISAADETLPKELKGTLARPPRYNVTWSIVIESHEADGTVKGKFNFEGRSCRLADLPFSGSYRGGVLQLNVPFTNSYCGPWDIKLKRTGSTGYEFEGMSTESTGTPANAYLKGS
ncbi:MAG: hypothetical protein ACRD3W_03895 [Terriglobales bacterium]